MKAKYYILLSALMLTASFAEAQFADSRDFIDNSAGTVVNNYYPDNDYYYSSRIRRFHSSYTAFDYYAPVFTDVYWYNYQPFTWGVSIYGGAAPFYGYSYNHCYMGIGMNFGNYNGWYEPYAGNYYYGGYEPYYYNNWYFHAGINLSFNIRIGNFWSGNHYAWHNNYYPHDYYRHNDYYGFNDYSHAYSSHNDFYGHNYYSSYRNSPSENHESRRSDYNGSDRNNNISGRDASSGSIKKTGDANRRSDERMFNTAATAGNRTEAGSANRRSQSQNQNQSQSQAASSNRNSVNRSYSPAQAPDRRSQTVVQENRNVGNSTVRENIRNSDFKRNTERSVNQGIEVSRRTVESASAGRQAPSGNESVSQFARRLPANPSPRSSAPEMRSRTERSSSAARQTSQPAQRRSSSTQTDRKATSKYVSASDGTHGGRR
jgi:hypothetical protein